MNSNEPHTVARIPRWHVFLFLVAAAAISALAILRPHPAHSAYVPNSADLRRPDIFLYPPRPSPPRALVFFFGNDVGFWEAHQEIAEFLAGNGYAVVGLDVKPLLAMLPDAPPPTRDSAIAAAVTRLIAQSRNEFRATDKPLVLMGHSLGAEIALWAAGKAQAQNLAGVVAMGPRARGHLRVAVADVANRGLPTEPGSFSVAEIIHCLPPELRIAIVRGDKDRYKSADSAFVSAGGRRLERFTVPLAGHSLKSVFVARYVVRTAVQYVIGR